MHSAHNQLNQTNTERSHPWWPSLLHSGWLAAAQARVERAAVGVPHVDLAVEARRRHERRRHERRAQHVLAVTTLLTPRAVRAHLTHLHDRQVRVGSRCVS